MEFADTAWIGPQEEPFQDAGVVHENHAGHASKGGRPAKVPRPPQAPGLGASLAVAAAIVAEAVDSPGTWRRLEFPGAEPRGQDSAGSLTSRNKRTSQSN